MAEVYGKEIPPINEDGVDRDKQYTGVVVGYEPKQYFGVIIVKPDDGQGIKAGANVRFVDRGSAGLKVDDKVRFQSSGFEEGSWIKKV